MTIRKSYLRIVLVVALFFVMFVLLLTTQDTLAQFTNRSLDRSVLDNPSTNFVSFLPILPRSYPPPPTGKIVFAAYREGLYDIYSMNIDGSDPIRLTTDPADDLNPDWSPDGSKITFTSNRSGSFDVYVMDADGGNQAKITSIGMARAPQWSPDGTRIAFYTWQQNIINTIYIINPDGSDLFRVTDPSMSASFPAWSPDGLRLAFIGKYPNAGIYVVNRDGTHLELLLRGSDIKLFAWSPNGKILALAKPVTPNNNYDLFLYRVDSGITTRLTETNKNHFGLGWSPDGDRLIFDSNLDDPLNQDIYFIKLDGTNLTNVTNAPGGDIEADWTR